MNCYVLRLWRSVVTWYKLFYVYIPLTITERYVVYCTCISGNAVHLCDNKYNYWNVSLQLLHWSIEESGSFELWLLKRCLYCIHFYAVFHLMLLIVLIWNLCRVKQKLLLAMEKEWLDYTLGISGEMSLIALQATHSLSTAWSRSPPALCALGAWTAL